VQQDRRTVQSLTRPHLTADVEVCQQKVIAACGEELGARLR
jgi:hypothetical protein